MPFNLSRCREVTWKDARNLISFWCFGLGNNFSYVIMLSAALDIIKRQEERPADYMLSEPFHHNCTKTGTASVLLADIIPSMTIKFIAPLFIHRLHFQ
ncbi:Battenin [Paragonimus heterotremus]|uniref:Battenin n=1 Tax=Paragonimus heterotremus TaxID=100268 RepID=A0A8J4T7Z7_9TREM|nr:Battenin [Paragonimus heterotremus]